MNDPFAGGTHLNDITLVAPCWVDGRLVGWAANRAHHADVGGDASGIQQTDLGALQELGPDTFPRQGVLSLDDDCDGGLHRSPRLADLHTPQPHLTCAKRELASRFFVKFGPTG